MKRFWGKYEASPLFHAFLRHGVWTWKTALNAGPLGILPYAFYCCVWWVALHLPAVVVAILAALISGIAALPLLAIAVTLSVAIHLPIITRLMGGLLAGYIACCALVIGNKAPATRILQAHKGALPVDGATS